MLGSRNVLTKLKDVLYSILGPNLLGLTIAVRRNIVGRCFSAVCRGLNHRRYLGPSRKGGGPFQVLYRFRGLVLRVRISAMLNFKITNC